ncbi:MAG: class I SAM-dependent methyltransferase [Candidatus Altiarchaeales archaeon]|nr:class I SAM-dependent methyltransferase [Candidatus Altiarchaeales archaeon]
MRGDWLRKLTKMQNPVFTRGDYERYSEMVSLALPFYQKHLKDGSRILELCCGLGCTAIPLSHHYHITALDQDDRILEYARMNARNFGGRIDFIKGDLRNIDKTFGRDSFDAVSSSGVMEYFPEDEVKQLVSRQLKIAPLVFINTLLSDISNTTDDFGTVKYSYSKNKWFNMLEGYNIIQHKMINELDEMMLVVKRDTKTK